MTLGQWVTVVANAVTFAMAIFIMWQQRRIRKDLEIIRDRQYDHWLNGTPYSTGH